MNKFLTILFIGRSGCGKSTQAELLRKYLKERGGKVVYVYAGEVLRQIAAENSLTGNLVKEVIEKGQLVPDFLAIFSWMKALVERFNERDEHLIFDGSPRSRNEAQILDEALEFYGRKNVFPILLDIERQEAFNRLKLRGRADDTEEAINHRLDFYDKYVASAVDYYKNESKNKLRVVNANPRDIKKIHQDILGILKTRKL